MEQMMMQAMATYEKRQGREIDAVEQHIFRTAYAMGVQDQQAATAIASANLRDAMLPALNLLHEYMESVGGCDHSVGICLCGEYAVFGDAARAAGWVTPNDQLNGPSGVAAKVRVEAPVGREGD